MKSTTAAAPGRRARPAGKGPASRAKQDPIGSTVGEIAELEQRDDLAMSWSDHLANLITAFSGSMLFVGLHVIWFGLWIVLNEGLLGFRPFDSFPYGLLTMIVSLEAIFLSTFVLISQNRQSLKADRRAKVDLQVNVIAEREITKVIEIVDDIKKALGTSRTDPEVRQMQKTTYVSDLADAVDKAEQKATPGSARAPKSAADKKS